MGNPIGFYRIIAVAACLATAMPGVVQAQTVNDEVSCVLLSNAMASQSNNPRGKQVGAAVGAYFMGRLDARPPAQVKTAIAAQKRRMTAAAAAKSMNACVARATRSELRLRALAK